MTQCDECKNQVDGSGVGHRPTCSMFGKKINKKRKRDEVGKREPSKRLEDKNQKEMSRLLNAAYGGRGQYFGEGDITPFLYKDLTVGADGRHYVSEEVRSDINKKVESTRKTFDSFDDLPEIVKSSSKKAKDEGLKFYRVSNRSSKTKYREGNDICYVEKTSQDFSGMRTGSDTPCPRSPHPSDTGEELPVPNIRYEKTHQTTFSMTGHPGSTVHAPTQANQVADTCIERYVAQKDGSFIVRDDTYERSTIIGVRPLPDGKYETKSTSYMRRDVKPDTGDGGSDLN